MVGAVGFNEDFLSGDDYEAILTIISEDCFEEFEEFNAQEGTKHGLQLSTVQKKP